MLGMAGGKKRGGLKAYGSLGVGSRADGTRRTVSAHRYSYEVFIGEIPNGLFICHKCDNRRCVNPNHLFHGTRKDNMQDAVSKGRQARGLRLPHAKLSEYQKGEILEKVLSGFKYKDIANYYGVTRHTINRLAIKNGVRKR
jgi:hypothetical protein